ncbi:DNA methyltransferase [Psychrobacter sp. KFRI-CH2-11]|uniref:Eco57I restriction-modification methylase domain-containing protein n=1 Tax=Psychrobacter sp. KFRI-CH2-11 TaxID=3156079 RepID=UPI00325370CD
MKLADHVEQIRELIEASFDKQFARLGFGKTKQMDDDKVANLPDEIKAKRERFIAMLDNHISETGSYESGREKLLDELTFTLFNRLAAIKVMEAANLFPPVLIKQVEHGDRSLGHKMWLEIYSHMRDEELEGIRDYIKFAFDELGGTLPLYSKAYAYALLPDTISLNDIIDRFNAVEIDEQITKEYVEGIWNSDDVLGWMYESYNNQKKQAHKDSKDKTEYHKVSLQSQVYTPRWVVQFLVENSLGKMYLEMYPDSEIKDNHKIANAPSTQARIPKPLHEVKIIDPACGSGNFLLYAFDFFYELYIDQIENYGADYEESDIAKLIIENNLHGIDLDDRAIQLAQLGLFIKAKKKRSSIGEINYNVVSSDFYLPEYDRVRQIFEQGNTLNKNQKELIEKVWSDLQNAYKFGSLVRIDEQIQDQLRAVEERAHDDLFAAADLAEHQSFAETFFKNLSEAVEQYARTSSDTFLTSQTQDAITFLELLTTKYDVATANPPYTDSTDFGPDLKKFVNDNYKKPYNFSTNLYATFIKRCYDLTNDYGVLALVHPQTFMYIKTFSDVREFMVEKTHLDLFVEWGYLGIEPPRDCRRLNILREYDNENTKLHS